MAKTGKTLSEQLIALTNPEPTSFDELDEDHEGLSARLVSRDAVESEAQMGRLDGEFFESGAIGRRAAAFLEDEDSRYAGRVTSRHKLSDKWALEESPKEVDKQSLSESTESDVNESVRSSDSEKPVDDEDSAEHSEKDSEMDDEVGHGQEHGTEDVRPFSVQNMKEETEKGQAVKSQLSE